MKSVTIRKGVVIEDFGDEIVAFVPTLGEAVKLSREAATTVRKIQSGDVAGLCQRTVELLGEHGIVTVVPGLDRRDLLRAGGLSAVAGMAVIALPATAAAASRVARAVNGTWDADSGNFYVQIPPNEVPEVSGRRLEDLTFEDPNNFLYDTTDGEWSFELTINSQTFIADYAYSFPGQGTNTDWVWTNDNVVPNPRPSGNIQGVMKRNGEYFADVTLVEASL